MNKHIHLLKSYFIRRVEFLSKTDKQVAPKILGRKYKVISGLVFNIGDIVTLVEDDGTDCPRFENKEGVQKYKEMNNVELLPEETQSFPQPVSQRNSTAFLGSKYLLTITGLTADKVTVNCIDVETSVIFRNQVFSTDGLFYKNMKPATAEEETVIKQLLEPANSLFTEESQVKTEPPVKFKKGQVWDFMLSFEEVVPLVEVTAINNKCVIVKYKGIFGKTVTVSLDKDADIWEDAILVSEETKG